MATSNATPVRDRKEAASRVPAVVIPLPGAAASPVVQAPRRGRLPRIVARLSDWRMRRELAIAERLNASNVTIYEMGQFLLHLSNETAELKRLAGEDTAALPRAELAAANERLCVLGAHRRAAFDTLRRAVERLG